MSKDTMNTKRDADAPEMKPTAVTVATQDPSPGVPTMEPDAFLSDANVDGDPRPTMSPPSEVVEEEIESAGIAAWHNSKKITAMWCNSSNRNAHAAIAGIGWKRISNANDSSFLALTMLASNAEQTNSNCNIRIESDGEIHEIYVW